LTLVSQAQVRETVAGKPTFRKPLGAVVTAHFYGLI
jgi:hypothetical protein